MIDLSFDDKAATDTPGLRAAARRLLLQEWPYLVMLLLVLFGVGYTGFTESPIRGYWMLLTPVIAAICVATAWPALPDSQERWRLIRTQALHWGAVLISMELIYIADATRMMTAEASALSVLTVLALGTFLAGIHLSAWRIAMVGVLLALAVPAITLLERSAMFLLLIGAAAAAVIVPVWWGYFRRTRSDAEPQPSSPSSITPAPTAPQQPSPDPLIDPRA